jgi:hypothetical protein
MLRPLPITPILSDTGSEMAYINAFSKQDLENLFCKWIILLVQLKVSQKFWQWLFLVPRITANADR